MYADGIPVADGLMVSTDRVRGLAKMEANLVATSRMIAEEGKKAP